MSTEVTDLPIEVVAKIFSFLKSKDILKLSTVSSQFYSASKYPSLWRRCKVYFLDNEERKISSFCSFFSDAPYLRELSITVYFTTSRHRRKMLKAAYQSTLNDLNRLFGNLKHLYCLHIDIKFKGVNIVFPPTLRHLQCSVVGPVVNEEHFLFLKGCSNIELLYLKIDYKVTKPALSTLLNYQLPLNSFYLEIIDFDEEWIPWISSLGNLKEFGIEGMSKRVNLSKLFGSSLASRLEVLYVRNVGVFESFSDFVFPELKRLTIIDSSPGSLRDCKRLILRMPKLNTFNFTSVLTDDFSLYFSSMFNFLNSCNNLKYVVLPAGHYGHGEEDVNAKFLKSYKGRNPENPWHVSFDYSYKAVSLSSLMCRCWDTVNNPRNAFINPTEKSLLIVCEEYYDDLEPDWQAR